MVEESNWKQQLSSHAGNDPSITLSLCDAFLQEVPALLSTVRQKVECSESVGQDLFQPLHTLKSCLNYVAQPEEIALAARLEQSAKASEIDKASFQLEFQRLDAIATAWTLRVGQFRTELTSKSSE